MKKILKAGWPLSLYAGLMVPTDSLESWKNLKFNKIPANEVSVVGGALQLTVAKSSSPLIYKFDRPVQVTGFDVKAHWEGKINLPEKEKQGDKKADDFVLKFGLVEAGKETLSWFQKKIAADWILQLYSLAPEGTGVNRINFFTTTQSSEQVGSERKHPLSDLIHEKRVLHLAKTGDFQLQQKLPTPMKVLGLWVSSDGDDTQSDLKLRLSQIKLETNDKLAE